MKKHSKFSRDQSFYWQNKKEREKERDENQAGGNSKLRSVVRGIIDEFRLLFSDKSCKEFCSLITPQSVYEKVQLTLIKGEAEDQAN